MHLHQPSWYEQVRDVRMSTLHHSHLHGQHGIVVIGHKLLGSQVQPSTISNERPSLALSQWQQYNGTCGTLFYWSLTCIVFTTKPKVHMLFGLSCHACQPEVMCTWKNTILRLVIFFITLLKSFSLALFYTSVIERLNEISTYGIQRNYFWRDSSIYSCKASF